MIVARAVMSVIIVVHVIMVSIVSMPVKRAPGIPVNGIVVPIPRRMPGDVAGKIYISNYRPGSNLIRCGPDHCNISIIPSITRVWCFRLIIGINGFNNIVTAI